MPCLGSAWNFANLASGNELKCFRLWRIDFS